MYETLQLINIKTFANILLIFLILIKYRIVDSDCFFIEKEHLIKYFIIRSVNLNSENSIMKMICVFLYDIHASFHSLIHLNT